MLLMSPKKRLQYHSNDVLILAQIIFFSIAYLLISFGRLNHFETSVDLAGYTQAVYNLSHLRLPFNTFKGMIMWGDHAHFIMAVIAPLYWLWPDARLLLTIQALALTSAAWPIYRLTQKYLKNNIIGYAVAFAYLIFSGLQYAVITDFHPSTLTGVALAWAVYLFETKRLRWFWLVFILGLITREDAPPIFFMWGIYLLLKKRWRIAPAIMVISAIYFLITVYFIMPMWLPSHIPLAYLDVSDKSLWGILRGFVVYPKSILQNMVDTPDKINTLNAIFMSFGYLSLLAPFTYLTAAPIIYSRFYSVNDYRWQLDNYSNANIAPILAVGAILGVGTAIWLGQKMLRRDFTKQITVIAAILIISCTTWQFHRDLKAPLWNMFNIYTGGIYADRRQAFAEIKKMIPANDAVSANAGFLADLAGRKNLYNFPELPKDTQWIVISREVNDWPINGPTTAHEIKELQKNPDWAEVAVEESIFVFKRL